MVEHSLALTSSKSDLQLALSGFASALSTLQPEQVPVAFEMADQLEKLAKEIREKLRDRLLKAAQGGIKVTDKGTMQVDVGAHTVRAIPTKTGTDPKKLEAKLRALGMDPAVAMDVDITYKVNAVKLAGLVSSGKLTYEDVAYNPSFRIEVQRGGG